MSESAAVINRSGRAESMAFDAVLEPSSPEVRQLAHAVRDLVYDVLPETVEVVWPKQGSVGWGIGPKKFSEQFCYLLYFKQHVTLGFYYGGELPDPASLLRAGDRQASGKLSMRSVKLVDISDVRRRELRQLVEAAVRHLRSQLGPRPET
jgi:hypothetical protein